MHEELEFAPAPQSMLVWLIRSVGLINFALLLLLALVAFVVTLIVVLRGKGAPAAVAVVLAVPLPLVCGVFLAFKETCSSFLVIAQSSAGPKPSEIAEGVSAALILPILGILLMAPSYTLALFGMLARSQKTSPEAPPIAAAARSA